MRRRLAHGLAMAFLVASLGAAQGPNNSEATPARARSVESKPEIRKQASKKAPNQKAPYQVGTASWYGSYFDGKPTASGEAYDMHDLTAAHPTLGKLRPGHQFTQRPGCSGPRQRPWTYRPGPHHRSVLWRRPSAGVPGTRVATRPPGCGQAW